MEKKHVLILGAAGVGITALILWSRQREDLEKYAVSHRVTKKNGPTAAPSPGPTLTPGILSSMFPRGDVATGSFEGAVRSLFSGLGGGQTGGVAEERAAVAATQRIAKEGGGWLSRVFGSLKASAPATTADTAASDARGGWFSGMLREWTESLRTLAAPSEAMERLRSDPGLVSAPSALPAQYQGKRRIELAREEQALIARVANQQALLDMITRELRREPSNSRMRIEEHLARQELRRLNGLRAAVTEYLAATVGQW